MSHTYAAFLSFVLLFLAFSHSITKDEIKELKLEIKKINEVICGVENNE